MSEKEQKEYIEFLEKKVVEMPNHLSDDLERFLKTQNDLHTLLYNDREKLLLQIRSLVEQNSSLLRTIAFDDAYIKFLTNSIWWKLSLPFRVFSRNKIQRKFSKQKNNFSICSDVENKNPLNKQIIIMITTYNAGKEFEFQIEYLKKQKLVDNLEIIIVDKGSTDETLDIAKKHDLKVMNLYNFKDKDAYFENLIISSAAYIIYLKQNKIIDDDYWIFKTIYPIENEQAILTAVYDMTFKSKIEEIKKESYFQDLQQRFFFMDNHYFLFLPPNRDNIQYLNPWVLDKASIVVKKNNL